jgi:hypothetical protein
MSKVGRRIGFLALILFILVMTCPVQAGDEQATGQDNFLDSFRVDIEESLARAQRVGEEGAGGNAAWIVGSVRRNAGIASLNQASGNMNNQSNVRAFSLGSSIQEIHVETVTKLGPADVYSIGGPRESLIDTSLGNSTGIVGINQSAGSLNSQTNTFIMALGGLVSVTEAELAEVSASNVFGEETAGRKDVIRDSLSTSRGVVQITQSSGDMNIQANTIAFSFREMCLR